MKFLLTLFIISCSLHSIAQFTIGPRAGLGTVFTDVSNTSTDIQSGDAQFGFSVGAFARFGSKKIKLMPELLYTTSTTSITFNDSSGAQQVADSELDKIDVPISLVLKPIGFLSLHGGITGSYITSTTDGFIDKTDEAIRNYKDFTFGYQFGGGVELGNVLLDLRYESGLSDTSTSSTTGLVFDERQSMIKGLIGFKIIGN